MSAAMTFEEAAEYLDMIADELPEGIVRELNGGVNLLPDERPSGTDGLSTLGMYYSGGAMGRYIELYYGSFVKLYGDRPRSVFERELKKTLYHELTHHIESLAGDRSLEIEDERFLEEYMSGMMYVDSVLFVSDGDFSLAAMAETLFKAACAEKGEDICCGAAFYRQGGSINDAAVKAAAGLGADISGVCPQQVCGSMLKKYDAVFCMTEACADELADEFPEFDARIFALGERDIETPRLASGYAKCAKRIDNDVRLLIDELLAEDGA